MGEERGAVPFVTDWSVGMKRATWAGDADSVVTFAVDGDIVVLDHVKRGPARVKGSAANMVADALRAAGLRPTTLRAPNVLQKTARSTSLINGLLHDVARLLGATVIEQRQGQDTDKIWLEVDLGY